MALLEVEGVRKSYPGVTALAGVDLKVEPGEVHALLGENGAGKSTLMKVIAGAVRCDGGYMRLAERDLIAGSPEEARAQGVAIVYQDLSLVPRLSVGENVLLGHWPRSRFGMIDWDRLYERSSGYLRQIGFVVDPRRPLSGLGMAERQLVEIAKALATSDARVLLLDEPTSALSEREAGRLFEVIKDLKDRDVAIVYVSHRLREILAIADRITVLRDGVRIGTISAADADEERLASMMVGREVASVEEIADRSPVSEKIVLRTKELASPPRLKPVDLTLHRGEVVGVFGLMGAGRSRLARSLFGLEGATSGTIEIFGREERIASPATAISRGMGYVGEDRAAGLVPRLSVAANVTLATLHDRSGLVIDFAGEREVARRFVENLDIRARSLDELVETLSGGNQQKVLLARWLCSNARILILDDPTRGVDVGAKEEVYRLVRRLASEDVSILYLTSEINEARSLPDRLLVMAGGSIVAEMDPAAPEDEIVAAAGGAYG